MNFESLVKGTHPWYMDPTLSAERIRTMHPSIRAHVQDLVEDGVTVIKGAIPKDDCKRIIASFKRFASRNPDKFSKYLDSDGHYPRIANLHAAMPELVDLFIKNRTALKVQQAMFDSPVALYTSLFYERGSAQDIHRDAPYFTTKPEFFYFGVWVALEDANEINGALNVVKGGHKIAEPDRTAIALKHFPSLNDVPSHSGLLWDGYQSEVQRLCKKAGLRTESLSVEAGDTVIWHPLLPHGGGKIQDLTRSRFSFVMHTTPVGVPVYHLNQFFNPEPEASQRSTWDYGSRENSYFVNHSSVDFAHLELFPVDAFA